MNFRIDCNKLCQQAETYLLYVKRFYSWLFCCEINLIRTNFTEISRKSEEFLQLELEQLIVILNSDELNVKSEEAVFNAVIRWIDYKVDERKQVGKEIEIFLLRFSLKNIIDLLKCVRLGLLTTNFFLEKVKCHPYIINNEMCKPLVIETLKYLYELDLDTHQVCDGCCVFLFGELISFSKGFISSKSNRTTSDTT
jgi:hypothetical protein